MKSLHAQKMGLKGLDHGFGQHGDTVFSALAIADHDLAITKIDVLDPQCQAFAQAQACAVKQTRHQPLRTAQLRQQMPHFAHREHRGPSRRTLGVLQSLQPRQCFGEHFLV